MNQYTNSEVMRMLEENDKLRFLRLTNSDGIGGQILRVGTLGRLILEEYSNPLVDWQLRIDEQWEFIGEGCRWKEALDLFVLGYIVTVICNNECVRLLPNGVLPSASGLRKLIADGLWFVGEFEGE